MLNFFRLKKINTYTLLFISGFFLMFFLAGQARAYNIENYQENVEERFVITPVNLELVISPGQTTTQQITIVNRLGKTANFKISEEDFVGSQDPEKVTHFLGDESAGITSAKDWVTSDVDEISLNHGDRLTAELTVTAPENAIAGSHYVAIFAATSVDSQEEKSGQVKLVSRVGTLILINVPGNNQESGEIAQLTADKNFYREGPVQFSTIFKNTGNIYQKVKGEIAIKNILGAEVARIPLKDSTVLSNSSRKLDATWNRKWLMGRYTANFTATSASGPPLPETNSPFPAEWESGQPLPVRSISPPPLRTED
jgi:hypothetical protein